MGYWLVKKHPGSSIGVGVGYGVGNNNPIIICCVTITAVSSGTSGMYLTEYIIEQKKNIATATAVLWHFQGMCPTCYRIKNK